MSLKNTDCSTVPWEYGEEAAKYMAKYLEAKHRLMPYLYNLVCFITYIREGRVTNVCIRHFLGT